MSHDRVDLDVSKDSQEETEVNSSKSMNENEVRSELDDNQNITDTKKIILGHHLGENDAESMTESGDFYLGHDVIACLDYVSGTRCILRSQKRKTNVDYSEFDNKKNRKSSLAERKIDQMQDEMSEKETNNGKEYKQQSSVKTSHANKVEMERTSKDVSENLTSPCQVSETSCDVTEMDMVETDEDKSINTHYSKDECNKNVVHSNGRKPEFDTNKSKSNATNTEKTERDVENTDALKNWQKTESTDIDTNIDESTRTNADRTLCKATNATETESHISNTIETEKHTSNINKSENKNTKENKSEVITIKISTKSSYLAHKEKHDSNKFICPICGKVLPNQSKLTYHMSNHNDDRIHNCSECDKSFKTRDVLTRHIRTHNVTRHFYCEICGVGFDQTGALQRHLLVHTDSKPHKCQVCGVEYRTGFSLKAHKLRTSHYSEDDKKRVPAITCDMCGKEFLSRYEYKRHYRTHTDAKPYTCTVCLKSFNDKSNLRQHSKIHDNDRPHSCGTCDRSFIQPRSLRKHLAESGHSDRDGNTISLAAKVEADKGVISLPCLGCNMRFKDWKTWHEHQTSSGHCEFSKILENRNEVCKDGETEMQVSPEKPVSVMSNFELLSAAATHVEKLALGEGSIKVVEPDRMDKTHPGGPVVEDQNLDKPETFESKDCISSRLPETFESKDCISSSLEEIQSFDSKVSGQSGKVIYEDKVDKNSNNEQNIPGSGSDMLKSLLLSDNVNYRAENTEFQQANLHNGSELHKILTANTNTQTGALSGNKIKTNTYPVTVKPKSKIILFKVNPESVPFTASKNTETNIRYAKFMSSGSKLTLQPSFVTSNLSSKFMPIYTTVQPKDAVQSTNIVNAHSFTGLKTNLESKNFVKTMSNIPLNYQSSELENLVNTGTQSRSQFHGTILRNIKPGSVSREPKSDPETKTIIQDLTAESFDLKTDSDATPTEVNTNQESDSTKLPDFCFDSDTILHNDNAKSENIDVNSYLDGSNFVESHSKTNSDSETTLTNTNSDNGNIFMNFLQEDSFSQNLYFNKPATTERQFDPFFYNNPSTQIFCASTSAETWPGSGSALNTSLLQDSKYHYDNTPM